MSSVAAFARPPSSATLHRDVKNAMKGSDPADQTNASSSAENGVSHFVNGSLGAHGTPKTPELASDDDYESPSSFLPHYHPQTPSGATQTQHRSSSGLLNRRANGKTLPSRTQQRLELQRRETMRSSATPSESDPADVPLSLRARSASRVRGRSSQDNFKAAKRDYESASSQLEVIKRFRNPIAEALHRLQEMEVIPDQDDKISNKFKDRPISRAGSRKSLNYRTATTEGRTTQGHEDRSEGREKEPRVASRGRVRFERQGSHDDIGLSRSHGDEEVDEAEAEGEDPVSAEEALLRRIWESRDVYEAT
ncbi:hypothetical protein UCRPC4_g02481 [Phaeomoniella chlamydospora]|uniref:Uncharacterized protein n=1 Tax=Phaeomoniella chlamydospora TaxID=158046 RepID=A0A0G2EQH1_PHACM|nr:hypothetical protein UCRPC4_g02481 [Phaeomoniella chlamydospora]